MADTGTFTTNTKVKTAAAGLNEGQPFITLAAKGTWGGATVRLIAVYSFAGVREEFIIGDSILTSDGVVVSSVTADEILVECAGGTGHSIKWAVA